MKSILTFSKIIFLTSLVFGLFGCANFFTPLRTEKATLGIKTKLTKELTSLPAPKDKIVAAVYKFRDQTGQYKASSTGSTFSTAVTQGATSILLKALEQSGWFVVIEREGLSDLLNERKIIRSSRANYEANNSNNQDLLPPLLFAGVILEGGIISYDTNVLTGGSGAKYFGIGGSGQYRQDRVTIYLRAISTQSGRILKTVYTTKTILSQMIDVGLYKFVDYQRLLEVETGYSYNEPVDMCVTEAIEKAVQSLVIEGIFDNLWSLKDPADINSPEIKNYLTEKKTTVSTDDFGQNLITPRKKYSVGVSYGGQLIEGDFPNSVTRTAGEIGFNYYFRDNFAVSANIGRGMLANTKYYESTIDNFGVNGIYYLLPEYTFSPYVFGGFKMLVEDKDMFKFTKNWFPVLSGGAGLEYLYDKIGFNLSMILNYSLNDDLDGMSHGKYNDYFYNAFFGINFYFGR